MSSDSYENFKMRRLSSERASSTTNVDGEKRPIPPVDKAKQKKKFESMLKDKSITGEETKESSLSGAKELTEAGAITATTSPVATIDTPIPSPIAPTNIPPDLLRIMKEEGISVEKISDPLYPPTDSVLEALKKKAKEEAIAVAMYKPQSNAGEVVLPIAAEKPQSAQETLKTLIDLCVKAISEEINPDKTSVRIDLKLPLFEGATVEITQYRSSPKDFAITFYNLTNPNARTLIEANEKTLRSELLQHGYTLQMMSIEPKIETSSNSFSFESGAQEKAKEQKRDSSGGLFDKR